MALPADAINKYKVQFDRQLIEQMEVEVRTMKPHIWETYVFTSPAGLTNGHSRETFGNSSGELSANQRKLRIIGCLLDVSWATSDANTEGLIVTAVQALIA